ncbi:RNA-binding cell elongation regulator Jag/EloR [Periweissella fabalis]|uniref:RNA-binding protein KhpB n=1 Tax=Periweissella fabalis TaxID=1070421 RepID=A0A7X6N3N0_9LACO|nr:RNA-binding cell elongation regulator Jag/EloR [Periweissella fabalis]MCM0599915.1 Jag N-terminal domain-containing protein [Periweissella fabalis]NKZ24029.1 KH domain-containing protein [Periweissella fabalis]
MARFKGKTIEEATNRGLKILGVNRNEVEIYVINAGQAKFFGLYHVSAEVEIIIKEQNQMMQSMQVATQSKPTMDEPSVGKTVDSQADIEAQELLERQAKNRERWEKATDDVIDYLVTILGALGIEGDLNATWGQNTLNIQFETTTEGLLIGKYGRTLNAMQTLATAYLSEAGINHPQVMLNVGNYREERTEKLERLAYRLADKVVSLGQSETLEPMPAFERKVIHSALADDPDILTTSIGKEPFRCVKIELTPEATARLDA